MFVPRPEGILSLCGKSPREIGTEVQGCETTVLHPCESAALFLSSCQERLACQMTKDITLSCRPFTGGGW